MPHHRRVHLPGLPVDRRAQRQGVRAADQVGPAVPGEGPGPGPPRRRRPRHHPHGRQPQHPQPRRLRRFHHGPGQDHELPGLPPPPVLVPALRLPAGSPRRHRPPAQGLPAREGQRPQGAAGGDPARHQLQLQEDLPAQDRRAARRAHPGRGRPDGARDDAAPRLQHAGGPHPPRARQPLARADPQDGRGLHPQPARHLPGHQLPDHEREAPPEHGRVHRPDAQQGRRPPLPHHDPQRHRRQVRRHEPPVPERRQALQAVRPAGGRRRPRDVSRRQGAPARVGRDRHLQRHAHPDVQPARPRRRPGRREQVPLPEPDERPQEHLLPAPELQPARRRRPDRRAEPPDRRRLRLHGRGGQGHRQAVPRGRLCVPVLRDREAGVRVALQLAGRVHGQLLHDLEQQGGEGAPRDLRHRVPLHRPGHFSRGLPAGDSAPLRHDTRAHRPPAHTPVLPRERGHVARLLRHAAALPDGAHRGRRLRRH